MDVITQNIEFDMLHRFHVESEQVLFRGNDVVDAHLHAADIGECSNGMHHGGSCRQYIEASASVLEPRNKVIDILGNKKQIKIC